MPPKSTQALEEAIISIFEHLAELTTSMDQRHSSLAYVVADLQQQLNHRPSSSTPSPLPPPLPSSSSPSFPAPVPPPILLKPPKLQLLTFDGPNVLDWIFQAEQFFTYYQVPPGHHLDMISFYMHGEALNWFKWMFTNHQLSSWDSFLRSLELRFSPSSFGNHQAILFKLD
ncbi:UNVERIFIED_CONTAM: hypothetical protein Slati_1513100 [Sesamum latifolium]|uniref:Retrotransposon gag domain-containing protein n=1 Tax=Sesamum latifolium TaxID=2727402 RepID=A0AAW2X9T4_9LAMI